MPKTRGHALFCNYGTSIPFLHDLFGRQIEVRATEIFSKTPNFYTCELVGGVEEVECNKLFIKAKELRDLQSVK